MAARPTRLYKKGHIHSPEDLPHQHQLDDYFLVKQIGQIRSISPVSTFKNWWTSAKRHYVQLEKKNPIAAYGAMAVLLVMGVSLLDGAGGNLFKASLVESPIKFDGTVYPYKKAPDWFHTGGENTRLYSSYKSSELIDAPRYSIPTMQKDDWAQSIVNPKITYSIVHSGQYKFNHKEYAGSHPGVDIKLATGTPVVSIANGIVSKAQAKTTGFGQHVVIRHDGVPEYGTLYSSYSHLSRIDVKVGQVIEKGEQLGLVGSTGSSTTPHIHFQIDKKDAPFHPYWPFSSADAKAAGVSFSGAVTAGVKKENVKKYTVHPFEFIHKYESGFYSSSSSSAGSLKSAPTQKISTPTPKPKTLAAQFHEIQISASPAKILEGDSTTISLVAVDKKGNQVLSFSEKVKLTYNDGEEKQTTVRMKRGEGSARIVLEDNGNTRITAEYNGKKETVRVNVKKRPKVEADTNATGKAENFDSFQWSGEKAVVEGETIFLTLRALDKDGNAIASSDFPAKGAYILKAKNGVVKPSKIMKGDFSKGLIQVSFKGKSRGLASVRVNNFQHDITVLQKATPLETVEEVNTSASVNEEKVFSDVSVSHKHSKAISYLKEHNIVNGYSDGSFQPNKAVSRSEALKMIFSAFKLTTSPNIDNPFSDVASDSWFKPFVLAAYDLEIVNGYSDGSFQPGKTVNRSEYFKILLNTADVPVDTDVLDAPFADAPADSWFAPYADFAKNEELLDFGNSFNPTKGITRAEVAESLYRILK